MIGVMVTSNSWNGTCLIFSIARQARVPVAADLLGALARAKIEVTDFALGAPSLDDVFFALTGRPAEAPAKSDGKQGAP